MSDTSIGLAIIGVVLCIFWIWDMAYPHARDNQPKS